MSITITVERPISRDGTYRTCFITDATTQNRDVFAYSVNDVIAAGYDDESAAYEFCTTYFSQKNKADYVLLKARYLGETLQQAFLQGDNNYSFICVESKDDTERQLFSNFILTKNKLFLYSGEIKITANKNTVWIGSTILENDSWQWFSGDDVLFASGDFVEMESA